MAETVHDKIKTVRKWADDVTIVHLFTDMLKFAGLKVTEARFRKTKEEPRTLTNFFSGATNILIIFPYEYHAAIAAGKCIQQLDAELAKMNVTFIDQLGLPRQSPQELMFYETLRFSQSDKNRFGIPKEEFLRKMRKKKYDLAIDLNIDFELASAYLCKTSNAENRVGFAHANAKSFYNILLNAQSTNTKQAQPTFDWLVQCLKMF